MTAHIPNTPKRPLRLAAAVANEKIARRIVEEIKHFRTVSPFGRSWEEFAVTSVLVALNSAICRRCRNG
jgi:hypothetical protein